MMIYRYSTIYILSLYHILIIPLYFLYTFYLIIRLSIYILYHFTISIYHYIIYIIP